MSVRAATELQQRDEHITIPEIRMENICKNFGIVRALDNVSFYLSPGEIRALVGENGAGKSTLMNILYGMYHQDSGTIRIQDETVPEKWSPNMAITRGIGMIHQHFSLINSHTVLENIVMPTLKWGEFKPKWKECEMKIEKLLEEYHFQVHLKDRVEDLSIGERQQVEIMKALYQGARVLILDEPTGVLTPQQAESLLQFLIDLRNRGYSVVLVTHKLNEAMYVSDKITILRGGKHISTIEKDKTNPQEIARMMVDRDWIASVKKEAVSEKLKPILEVRNLTVENENRKTAVDNVSFTMGTGEIVGVAGVAGNGQVELAEALIGLKKCKDGIILLEGTDIGQWDVAKRRLEGIGYIPEDRHGDGMVGDMTIAENLVLDCIGKQPYSKNGIIQPKVIKTQAEQIISDYNVKANGPDVPMKNLSGGNQQKVIMARTLMETPKAIIACQPTRGLDFSAMEYVRKKLVESADKGMGVLLISSDLDELFELCDRIIVMYHGKVVGDIKKEEVDLNTLGLMMTGYKDNEVEVSN